MARVKPKMFVGSSSEGRRAANAFCRVLSDAATMMPWWLSPHFQAGNNTLADLLAAANGHDFGLFVMTADDVGTSRGVTQSTVRDNVLFEYGMFIGVLGSDRTFAVVAPSESGQPSVRVPTDLLGINMPRFSTSSEAELLASANNAAQPILDRIEKLGLFERRMRLVQSFEYRPSVPPVFSVGISAAFLASELDRLRGKTLCLIARKQDLRVAFEDDRKIVKGSPLKVPRFAQELVLEVSDAAVFADVKAGDVIEYYLLVLPEELDLGTCATMNDMLNHGGARADGGGTEIG